MDKAAHIAISGFFDPIHSGHLDYLEAAAKHGDVWVLLNSDEAAKRKKGYVFMKYYERERILKSLKCVTHVIEAQDSDGTVCESLRKLASKINYFGKGGDRIKGNTPENDLCEKLGIKVIYGLGGDKVQSSSDLVKNAKANSQKLGMVHGSL